MKTHSGVIITSVSFVVFDFKRIRLAGKPTFWSDDRFQLTFGEPKALGITDRRAKKVKLLVLSNGKMEPFDFLSAGV